MPEALTTIPRHVHYPIFLAFSTGQCGRHLGSRTVTLHGLDSHTLCDLCHGPLGWSLVPFD